MLILQGGCVAQELNEEVIGDVLGSLQYATEAAQGWAKAWHNWALFNVQVSPFYCSHNVHVIGCTLPLALIFASLHVHCKASLSKGPAFMQQAVRVKAHLLFGAIVAF